MPTTVQYALMAVAVPFSLWLLLGGRGRSAASSRLPAAKQVMLRALASIALLVSTIFGWMLPTRGDAEPPGPRDDSRDEWRAERDTEGEKRKRNNRHQ